MGRVGSKQRRVEQHVSPARRGWGVLTALGTGVACALFACTEISDDAELSSEGTLTHSGGHPGTEADAGPAGAAGAGTASTGSAGVSGGAGAAGSGAAGTSAGGSSSGGSAGSAGQTGSGQAGSTGTPPAGNLISNPDFELGIAPWSAGFGGTLSLSVEQAHSGTHCGKVTNRTQAYQGAHYDLTNVVTPGAEYAVGAWGRIGNGATSTAPLKLTALFKCTGLADQYVTVRQLSAASDAVWNELKGGKLAVPSSDACDIVQVLLYLEGPPPGYDLYIDDVTVTAL